MLVSIKNLKQYLSLEGLTPELIADKLTFAGIEVEEVTHLASGTNLVIGEVLECLPHPDSDHLHVLKVDLGTKYGVTQIVCGAPNAHQGLKVIVARVGAKLPQMEIKAATIRGVESQGMCCSLLELGVDSKYLTEYQQNGIEELPLDAKVGNEKVLEYLGLDDVILNIKVLANRPDLLSVFNVAREIGAIFSRPVTIPEVKCSVDFTTSLVVGSKTEKCPQFAAREIRGIVTKESPQWLKEYLMGMGIRSINNIVDIGNYVMLLTGQPLHMYDADKLKEKELIARDDYQGSLVALDGKSYDIIKGDIVITCHRRPQCLGGVMGAHKCAVDEKTTNLYIEAASFNSASIRHTSNRLGLASESSSRFVKGTNHFQAEFVLDYAASLLKELGEAQEVSNIVEYQNEEQVEQRVISDIKYINARLGTNFTGKEIKEALERLHFQVMLNVTGYFIAIVPPWRLDISGSADLSEEVIRLLGFDKIPSLLPCFDTKVGLLSLKQQRLRQIRSFFLDQGLDECLTYSLLSQKEAKAFNVLNNEESFTILHPLTDEHEVLRTHILHSLLKVASFNAARQNKDLALFETSSVQSLVSRSEHLALVLVGEEQ
ncbi:MAG: phenylalanine--tRNA ligase subunit beta, partial [Bacilli bacterium]